MINSNAQYHINKDRHATDTTDMVRKVIGEQSKSSDSNDIQDPERCIKTEKDCTMMRRQERQTAKKRK
jgi:hypothetical protein